MFDTDWMEVTGRLPGEPKVEVVESLRRMVDKVRPVSMAQERVLPFSQDLDGLLEGGLRRGTSVALEGESGVTSLALALCAQATISGMWLGCLNTPSLGWASAVELGVDLRHVVVVDVEDHDVLDAIGVMVDVFDMVMCGDLRELPHSKVRKLLARVKERGCVLVTMGERSKTVLAGWGVTQERFEGWGEVPDSLVYVEGVTWAGLGAGRGRLGERRLVVRVKNRRGLVRTHPIEVRLPAKGGAVLDDAQCSESSPVVRLCYSDGEYLIRERPNGDSVPERHEDQSRAG
ncbi:MAG: hypothetical protein KDB26_02600 [Microthrixaceae bacterium]|nr:hypothetical protein [Microthrixaceae bacterium]